MRYNIRTYLSVGTFQMLWGTVKYIPSPLGDIFRFGLLKLYMRRISSAWLRTGIHIWWPENISIGKGTFLNEDMHMNGIGGITIGDNVLIGHRCTICSDEHVFKNPEELIAQQGRCEAPIVIEDDVYLGCNVVILRGVRIGRGAVIGAGSVVTKDIPPLAIAYGSPAKVVKYRGDKKG